MWSWAIGALFIAAFAVGTSELIIAGILPALATDFQVSIPAAGVLISAYALGVAIGGPILALATTRARRRPLLLILMTVFVAAQLVCAFAPGYWLMLVGRLVAAASQGLFFGVATVIAVGMVPENRRSSVISIVAGGVTIANLLGAPLGTALGNAVGWRWVFIAIALMGIVATLVMAAFVPEPKADTPARNGNHGKDFLPVRRQAVYLSFAMIAVGVTGYLALFAYLVPFLTTVSGVPLSLVPVLLFLAGVGGTIGTFVGGRLGDWQPMPGLAGAHLLTALSYLLVILAARNAILVTLALFILSVVAWSFVAPVQARIMKWAADAPNLVSTLISTAFNVGVAAGAWIGGVAISAGWTFDQLPWIGAVMSSMALLITLLSWAIERRQKATAPVVAA